MMEVEELLAALFLLPHGLGVSRISHSLYGKTGLYHRYQKTTARFTMLILLQCLPLTSLISTAKSSKKKKKL